MSWERVSEEFSKKCWQSCQIYPNLSWATFPLQFHRCPTPLSLLPRSSLRRLDNISTKPARDLGLGDDTLQWQKIEQWQAITSKAWQSHHSRSMRWYCTDYISEANALGFFLNSATAFSASLIPECSARLQISEWAKLARSLTFGVCPRLHAFLAQCFIKSIVHITLHMTNA